YSVFDLQGLPTISKDDLIENFDTIRTVSETDGLVSFTGGTTGASLKVLYKWEDVQERRAFLDLFWEQYGYKHGSKTAWFSGKHIIPKEDSKILWRTDFINHFRYYSTFHITKSRIRHYIDSLNEFKPEFMVGFPSSVYEIARLGLEENLQFNGQIRCFFPTAESLVPEEVKVIQEFFKCEVRNQYASSE